ncbi:MAG: CehA/McbA family metallohydrolase [Actinomycetota bacterium]|nr:CehA/McbA family metallohydrolase [Actinomycetota bacterium]
MRFHGRWAPEDRADSIYRYVPFQVPVGTRGLAVRLDYDRTSGVIDLGAFDPAGFRGYSGGARGAFVITRSAATPGYLPGPITAGEWQVLLGLYLIPPQGLEWRVEVDLASGNPPPLPPPPPRARRPPRRDVPATEGRRWLIGDLHSHTVHSDGTLTIDQLANLARSRGLDFLAVTDHNTVSHHPHLPGAAARFAVQLIPGQELTTDRGHANCFGEVGWVDFRASADDWLSRSEDSGGLLSVNHPLDPSCGWHRPLGQSPPLLEVWHKTWDRRSPAPLEWWAGRGGVPVGGSDFHSPADRLGAPTTWVEAEDDDVLGGLRAGRVALSAEPDGPVVLRLEGELVVIDGEGGALVGAEDRRMVGSERARLPAGRGPYRLLDPTGLVVALTP